MAFSTSCNYCPPLIWQAAEAVKAVAICRRRKSEAIRVRGVIDHPVLCPLRTGYRHFVTPTQLSFRTRGLTWTWNWGVCGWRATDWKKSSFQRDFLLVLFCRVQTLLSIITILQSFKCLWLSWKGTFSSKSSKLASNETKPPTGVRVLLSKLRPKSIKGKAKHVSSSENLQWLSFFSSSKKCPQFHQAAAASATPANANSFSRSSAKRSLPEFLLCVLQGLFKGGSRQLLLGYKSAERKRTQRWTLRLTENTLKKRLAKVEEADFRSELLEVLTLKTSAVCAGCSYAINRTTSRTSKHLNAYKRWHGKW